MKKLFIVCALLLLPQICVGSVVITDWKYYKTVPAESEGLKKFLVDDQIFAGTTRDLRDLRILDQTGREVPYKLLKSQAKSEIRAYQPVLLNNTYDNAQNSAVVLDFGANRTSVNSLEIGTETRNFQANVRILGGNDLTDLKTIKENIYIYDYTDQRGNFQAQKTSLNFPLSTFRYLKLEIASNNDIPVKISAVTAEKITHEKSKELERQATFTSVEKGANTEIVIDLETGGIPTSRLQLASTDKNFSRGVLIYSSYDNNKWRRLGSGNIFSFGTDKFKGENLELTFTETNNRYLKLVISNLDNAPLTIDTVKSYSVYREVVFQAEQAEAYRVYYGNPKATFPRYDLDSYFQYLDLSQAEELRLSAQKKNSAYQAIATASNPPQSEEIPWLMPFALIVSSLLLLFLVFRFFQK